MSNILVHCKKKDFSCYSSIRLSLRDRQKAISSVRDIFCLYIQRFLDTYRHPSWRRGLSSRELMSGQEAGGSCAKLESMTSMAGNSPAGQNERADGYLFHLESLF